MTFCYATLPSFVFENQLSVTDVARSFSKMLLLQLLSRSPFFSIVKLHFIFSFVMSYQFPFSPPLHLS